MKVMADALTRYEHEQQTPADILLIRAMMQELSEQWINCNVSLRRLRVPQNGVPGTVQGWMLLICASDEGPAVAWIQRPVLAAIEAINSDGFDGLVYALDQEWQDQYGDASEELRSDYEPPDDGDQAEGETDAGESATDGVHSSDAPGPGSEDHEKGPAPPSTPEEG